MGPSDHRDQFALSVAVAVDVPLRGLDRAMTGQQLNVPQAAACLVDDAGGTGDERPAAGMGRAAFQANILERPVTIRATRGRNASNRAFSSKCNFLISLDRILRQVTLSATLTARIRYLP